MSDTANSTGIVARFHVDRGQFSLNVDLALPGGGVTALFGHSGSGKTTVLRCVAGLERAPQGFLSFGGEVWQDDKESIFIPPHRRPIGVVFQEASLFSHLSVMGNLRYGMTRAGLTPNQAWMVFCRCWASRGWSTVARGYSPEESASGLP